MSNSQGKIVVNADEWTFSDRGFQKAPDAATLAINLAKYFVGDEKGKFHVLSNNWSLTESSLEETMTKSGHTWTKGMNIPINLATLSQYDGIFIGGDPIDNQVLIEYVKNGGKVYLCAATSEVGSQLEAKNWNTFLTAFGLKLEKLNNTVRENVAVNKNHPLFSGVKTLYQDQGIQIIDLQPDSPHNQIILTNSNGQGLMATAEFIKVPVPKPLNGRIVVNADEWTFSDRGFQNAPDTATFANNLAKYFVGDEKGKFHVLSNNWGLTESSLEETMTKSGHTWTKGMDIPINLATLEQYDAIFIGGDPIDNQVLIEYVKNGGKVYLWAGTGQGGSQLEANNWNTFLAEFGLKLQKSSNTVSENVVVNKNDPLFSGVKTLYQDRGIHIIDLQPDSSLNQIILTNNTSGQGLMATAEFIKTPIRQTATQTTPALEVLVDVTPALEPEIAPEAPVEITPALEPTPALEVLVDVTPALEPAIAPEAPVEITPAPEPTPTLEVLVDVTPALEPAIAPEAVVEITPALEPEIAPEAPVEITPALEPIPTLEVLVDVTPALEPEIAPEAVVEITPALEPEIAPEAVVEITPALEPTPALEAVVEITPALEPTPALEVLVDVTPALEPEIAPEAVVEITAALEPAIALEALVEITAALEPAIASLPPVDETPALEPAVDETPAPEPTPEPSVSDTEEFTITATTDVTISKLFYKGEVKRTQSDEYIEISNLGNSPANISDWKITSGGSQKQSFTFPEGTILEGGKSFRVYTNEVHPETGGFSYGSKSAIWNDAGDEAKLFDAAGNNVSTLAYGKNTVAGITQELQVSQLKFVASYAVINKQMALGGKVTFTEAVSLAIKSFLEDDSNANSPLALIRKDPVAFGLSTRVTKAMAIERLRYFMNEEGTLSLLPTAKRSTGENGETVEENWIFELSLGAFGETTFYTVVPR
ncbi:lamin tail domain-containing protein [Aerosakkonemataceae cyanobacterium BLCC-F50]|uniref:Lamin tail domain-containing protein n=1 Tax=Floridaenema flaviceps BLCC-F50 TaxID=3153642 RepID=A0ABV4XKB4_9CYAN